MHFSQHFFLEKCPEKAIGKPKWYHEKLRIK